MKFVEECIVNILEKRPSECAYLDYKQIPYNKDNYSTFVIDVIAMLNSEEAYGMDKYIVIGVTDDKIKIGLKMPMPDDNVFQNWGDFILPRPSFQSGICNHDDKEYGYIYIPGFNTKRIYEVGKDILCKKRNLTTGQSFIRQGSRNNPMTCQERESIRTSVRKYFFHFDKNCKLTLGENELEYILQMLLCEDTLQIEQIHISNDFIDNTINCVIKDIELNKYPPSAVNMYSVYRTIQRKYQPQLESIKYGIVALFNNQYLINYRSLKLLFLALRSLLELAMPYREHNDEVQIDHYLRKENVYFKSYIPKLVFEEYLNADFRADMVIPEYVFTSQLPDEIIYQYVIPEYLLKYGKSMLGEMNERLLNIFDWYCGYA